MISKADRTKAFIIEKTAPLFNRKGFAGTSLSDITAITGLSKGSIYSNFRDKDDIALAVFDYNWKKLQALIVSEMEKRGNIFEKLMVYPEVYERILKDPVLKAGCPILNTATEADDTHHKLKVKAKNAMISWRTELRKLIQKGIRSGDLRDDLNATETAFTMIAMIEGSIMVSKLTGQMADRKFTRHSMEGFINSLRKISTNLS